MDALTKVLVGLYEEPDRLHINAVDYVKKYLGAPTGIDLDGLKRENEALKKQVEKYKKQLSIQDKDQHQPEATKNQKGGMVG
jgi:predicted ATP-grasp superfamily ATP-dependent carboligase